MPKIPVTTQTILQCPHGGTVRIVSANMRVATHGEFLTGIADQFQVIGCTHPVPCTSVMWAPNQRVLINGTPAVFLSPEQPGTCVRVPPEPAILVTAMPPPVFAL